MTRKDPQDLIPSKIPRLIPINMAAMILKKPSRLELMKEEFHKKLMKEKEQKIIELYESNKNRSLDKVRNNSVKRTLNNFHNNKQDSSVRNFFEEGRAIGARGNMAAIQAHYTRPYKINARRSSDPNTGTYLQKRSAGRDRAHPLAPIEKKNTNEEIKKPLNQRHKYSAENTPSAAKSYSAPSKPKPKKLDMNDNESLRSKSDSPPELAQLENLKRRNSLGSNSGDGTPFMGVAIEEMSHLTDFQKWQLEQMRAKEERLFKRNQKMRKQNQSPEESDEGISLEQEQALIEEQLVIKQNELIAKINEETAQLEKMKLERQKNIEKEQREAERREQRAVIEREKQQKLERERKKEQERRKMEQQKKDEERRARVEMERARAQEEEETEEERPQQQYTPHPPPQPRKNTRRPPPRARTPPALDDGEELEKIDGPDVNFYIQAAEQADGASTMRLAECGICGRKFAQDRLQKHENACKTSNKKRKTFDPVKMRLQGTEAIQYQHSIAAEKKTPTKPKKKDWRKQHEEFISAISYAKKVSEMEKRGGDIRTITPPPPTENPDYVPCPTCGRKFNATAAERHIPRCKDIKGKPARRR